MDISKRFALAIVLTCGTTGYAWAQDIPAAQVPALAEPACELHVWPTENFTGVNTGLLSGFGLVGALADQAAHKDRVTTVKGLMADYLGPKVQVEELDKVGFLKILNVTNYRVVVEEPMPSNEEIKDNPAINAAAKEFKAKLKAGKRLTNSKVPCYGELLINRLMYHKAMMYGSNLFVGTVYRDFSGPGGAVRQSSGWVKNPLENFPPKSPEMVEPAKAELRDAFGKGFVEWSQKKLNSSLPRD